jgi:TolB-like protein/DNA-binding winged helix-turn-helix (wHTH) protein
MFNQPVAFGPFLLDMHRAALLRDGRSVAVGNKGLLLLQALLLSPGKAVDKTTLMEAAWPGTAVEESNLSVQIAALRKLLGPSEDGGEWIATVPRVGYRFVGPVSGPPLSVDVETLRPAEPVAQFLGPSIAVLPFSILGGGGDKEYVADGITDDIITALTRFRWFRVIARNSSFAYKGRSVDARQIAQDLGVRYLLEGSVRHSPQRIRISAQLIDATSGSHVWAERYDLELADVFAIQDEIAERVAGAIEPELLKTESKLAASRHTGNMTAWDLVRRGAWHFHKVSQESHLKARDLFRQACAADPDLPEAHIWLARVSAGLVAYGWSQTPSTDIKEGTEAAAKAIYLDANDPYAHYAFAITSAHADAPKQAVLAAERAIQLSPSFALGHLVLGLARLYNGQALDAIAPLEHGLVLNPSDPQNFVWLGLLAWAQLFSGQADAALINANRALTLRPTWRGTFSALACCNVALDRMDEAHRCVVRMDELGMPGAGGDASPRGLGRLNPAWNEKIVQMLQRARSNQPSLPLRPA